MKKKLLSECRMQVAEWLLNAALAVADPKHRDAPALGQALAAYFAHAIRNGDKP